ncbi:hypothetical protein ACJMK2_019932, partial [Sinanodonta woodiana]
MIRRQKRRNYGDERLKCPNYSSSRREVYISNYKEEKSVTAAIKRRFECSNCSCKEEDK